MLEKTQKQDIYIDRKGSTAKKHISIESCKYSFHVVASTCLQKKFSKKVSLLNYLQIEAER